MGCQNRIPSGDGSTQGQRAVEPFSNFLHQRKGALDARVSARTGRHGNQAVCAFLDRFAGKPVVDDVVQHHPTVAVCSGVDVFTRPQRCDDHWNLVFDAHFHVVLKPVIAFMNDLIDRKRGRQSIRMRPIMGGQCLGDLG